VEVAAAAETTVDHALEAPTIHPGTKPPSITAPESSKIDDLKLINGIGAEEEKISTRSESITFIRSPIAIA
jgi:predicted flap endonuclease-1-like 5' DNA nuclease